MTLMPLFYFKPTLCWIDDDQIFLDAIKLSFSQYYKCLMFNDSLKASDFFDKYKSPFNSINFRREFKESDMHGVGDHWPVDLNIPEINKLLLNNARFEEIAILIIDYNMPNMHGLELCEKLKDLPVKKILLTGEATHKKAVESFNKGLIHRFIKKEHDVYENLQQTIEELTFKFFCDKTSDLISHIETSGPSLFSDPVFVNFFMNWCKEYDIEEFYLLNKSGNFVAKDKNNKKHYLITLSETDKKEFIELAEEFSDVLSSLLTQMESGKIIPFFGVNKESWHVDIDEWKNYFYEAQIISGRENYYWTAIHE